MEETNLIVFLFWSSVGQIHTKSVDNWWRIILFLFKIIEYDVSWLRKLSEIPTRH